MKKIAIVLAVLLAAVPAMAVVTITATDLGGGDVDISFVTSGEGGKLPRAFALDITVDSGTIDAISGYFTGECSSDSNGFGIFPANFNRHIDADDPCWGEPNYTPVADKNDLPGDTEDGLGTAGITIEMGSLYKGPNSPKDYGSLAVVTVSSSCNLSLAANIGRGKVIMEDGNEPASLVLNGTAVVVCTVPNVVGSTEAAACAAIVGAGFVCNTTYQFDDVVAVGLVISQDPGPGKQPCGSTVNIVVSLGPCTVPNVVGQAEATAVVNVEGNGFVASVVYAKDDVVAAGLVISTTPSAGATPGCGTTVTITVSTGPCVVPNVIGMTEAAATTAITNAGFTLGTVTYVAGAPLDDVVAQSPGAAATPGCGTAVDIDVTADCMKASHPAYSRWVTKGKPACWCYRKNCRGDTNGTAEGPFWVDTADKSLMVSALGQIILPPNGICCDLDRADIGPFAVGDADKTIFVQYLGQIVVPDCDGTHINYWNN
ncbi:MAG: PASTA domain-containing protein [Planctomycetota bacterium]|jgi:beta-lactam-binding protein with PASTA domain